MLFPMRVSPWAKLPAWHVLRISCVLLLALTLSESATAASGNRWLILMCGLPGDDEHRENLTEAVKLIATSASSALQVEAPRLKVVVGDETMVSDLAKELPSAPICTRESVAEILQGVAKDMQPVDACWLIMLGHASYYNNRSAFNVQGRDFDAQELVGWLKPIQSQERVIFCTFPVSGMWLKPLRDNHAVTIAATDGSEFTATEMPYALARVLSGKHETQELADIDKDGSISLLDLYLATNLEIHGRFKSLERLQSDHALLDDNGDGLGRELQTAYLPLDESPDKAITKRKKSAVKSSNSDGDLAKRILLRVVPK